MVKSSWSFDCSDKTPFYVLTTVTLCANTNEKGWTRVRVHRYFGKTAVPFSAYCTSVQDEFVDISRYLHEGNHRLLHVEVGHARNNKACWQLESCDKVGSKVAMRIQRKKATRGRLVLQVLHLAPQRDEALPCRWSVWRNVAS